MSEIAIHFNNLFITLCVFMVKKGNFRAKRKKKKLNTYHSLCSFFHPCSPSVVVGIMQVLQGVLLLFSRLYMLVLTKCKDKILKSLLSSNVLSLVLFSVYFSTNKSWFFLHFFRLQLRQFHQK